MTDDEYRKGQLMMTSVFRALTEAEREELVSLLTASEPSVSGSDRG